jgi:hypothetical protein
LFVAGALPASRHTLDMVLSLGIKKAGKAKLSVRDLGPTMGVELLGGQAGSSPSPPSKIQRASGREGAPELGSYGKAVPRGRELFSLLTWLVGKSGLANYLREAVHIEGDGKVHHRRPEDVGQARVGGHVE